MPPSWEGEHQTLAKWKDNEGFTYRPVCPLVACPNTARGTSGQLSLWCWKIYYREENNTSFSKVPTYT